MGIVNDIGRGIENVGRSMQGKGNCAICNARLDDANHWLCKECYRRNKGFIHEEIR